MRSRPSIPALLVIGCLALSLALTASCRRGGEPKGTPKAQKPVATAIQSAETPTLGAPPPPPAPAPAEVAPPPAPAGPITLMPPEAAAPPSEVPAAPAAPAAAMLPAEVQAPVGPTTPPAEAPPPVGPTPPAEAPPPSGPTTPAAPPLATSFAPTAGTLPPLAAVPPIAALPAPEVTAVPEEATKEAEAVAYEPRLVTAQTNIELLLDASGSMAAPAGAANESKYDLLRRAVYDVLSEMGQQQAEFPRNVAVRLLGSASEAAAVNCEDSELVAGMGAPNLTDLRRVLDPTAPRGQSPIAFALTEAGDDFPSGIAADRVIVLVADGWDTCGGDPCDATRRLELGAQKVLVHTIAFDVGPEDQAKLECIARASDGQFFLARNEAELRNSLDQAMNSTIPYNLKLTATASGLPLPVTVSVLKAGTQEVARRGESLGTKLLSLPPGSYDVLIEYTQSPEARKPSKILKGVEISSTTRVEQTVAFDLGQLSLSAVGNEGQPTGARFRIMRRGGTELVATVETDGPPVPVFLTPDTYDIAADPIEAQPDAFTVLEGNVAVKVNEAQDLLFKFQKGTLALSASTTQKEALPFLFVASKAGSEAPIASGALPAEGGSVMLPPGAYDLVIVGQDPKMAASPRTKIAGVAIKSGETTEINATMEMGSLTLSAVDGKGNRLPADFSVRDPAAGSQEMARASSPTGNPVQLLVPPGTYDVLAQSLKSTLVPKPMALMTGIAVSSTTPAEQVIRFVLGTVRLRGRSAKEQPIRTQFTVFPSGEDQALTQAPPSSDWTVFDLAPGVYDILATDLSDATVIDEGHPMIWIRELHVEDGKETSHEAIFTAGKLKIIGRGPNNEVITTHFKVFKYGADRELISGETGNDWEIFQIEPGKYYLEAAYHDEEEAVMLKKWINVDVGENEIVEIVLRF